MHGIGNEWARAVVHPLGLAGLSLFIIFSFVSKLKKSDKRPWQAPALFGLALLSLVGGLFLANRSVEREASALQQKVQQNSTGAGSPNFNNVQGDLNITIDQSTNKGETAQPGEKKPDKK